jgi:hypothetical protein
MLTQKKVAAYFAPWKNKIERLGRGDHVFLYRSGTGIVALGIADGNLRQDAYKGRPENKDEEYAMGLLEFQIVMPPLTAADVKTITENPGLIFRQTMFGLDHQSGSRLPAAARARKN